MEEEHSGWMEEHCKRPYSERAVDLRRPQWLHQSGQEQAHKRRSWRVAGGADQVGPLKREMGKVLSKPIA